MADMIHGKIFVRVGLLLDCQGKPSRNSPESGIFQISS